MCHTIETIPPPFPSLGSTGDDRVEIEYPDQDSYVSDSESCVSGPATVGFKQPGLFHDGLVMLDEDDRFHRVIKQRFLSGLAKQLQLQLQLPLYSTTVVKIHKNNWSASFTGRGKVQAFEIRRQFIERQAQAPEDVNLKFAWFGTSKAGVERIMSHGFGVCELDQNNGLYGRGVYFSPDYSPLESVQSADVDEDGFRHVVLCRVLLGKMELVHPSSDQSHPSSEEFHSGADCLQSPKKYIVWSTHMNTHILPEYIVSFRAPLQLSNAHRDVKIPTSPWMPFPALIQELAKFLPTSSVGLISKHHKDYKERKISRSRLIKHIRQLAGDKLLTALLKSRRSKNARGKNTI